MIKVPIISICVSHHCLLPTTFLLKHVNQMSQSRWRFLSISNVHSFSNRKDFFQWQVQEAFGDLGLIDEKCIEFPTVSSTPFLEGETIVDHLLEFLQYYIRRITSLAYLASRSTQSTTGILSSSIVILVSGHDLSPWIYRL